MLTSRLLTSCLLLWCDVLFAAPGYNVTLRNARLDAITAAVGTGGTLTVYSGTRPATCGTATTPLIAFTNSGTFAPAASNGTLSPTLSAYSGLATGAGTATWFRVATSAGSCVMDGSVGLFGADINLNVTTINAGTPVNVTSWTITGGNQ